MMDRKHWGWNVFKNSFRVEVEMKFQEIGTNSRKTSGNWAQKNSRKDYNKRKRENGKWVKGSILAERNLSIGPPMIQNFFLHNPRCYLRLKILLELTSPFSVCIWCVQISNFFVKIDIYIWYIILFKVYNMLIWHIYIL